MQDTARAEQKTGDPKVSGSLLCSMSCEIASVDGGHHHGGKRRIEAGLAARETLGRMGRHLLELELDGLGRTAALDGVGHGTSNTARRLGGAHLAGFGIAQVVAIDREHHVAVLETGP